VFRPKPTRLESGVRPGPYNVTMWEPRRPAASGVLVVSSALLGGCTPDAGVWWFGIAALAVAAAGGGGIGWLLARQRDMAALHDARQQLRLLRGLAGGEVWRSDAQGRQQDTGQPVLANYDTAATADLPARLRLPQALGPLLLTRTGPPGPLALPCVVEVRGEPCYDAQGRFDGLLGLSRPQDVGDLATAALGAVGLAWPAPMLTLARQGEAGPWHVVQANPPARQRFGDAPLIEEAALSAALPASLRPGGSDPSAEADGWHLRRLEAAGHRLCVVWQTDGSEGSERASFSYTVSHDLRAPIRVVEGFTRIVKEDYGSVLDRVANDHLDRVLGAAARMNQMIDAMLTLARLSSQPLARQPVNLSQLATYVVDDLRRAAPEREASIAIDPDLQTQGDPTLMRLVLENLLGNAWKYSARRAHTRIEFGRELIDGRHVYVVRDNGAGFDMRSVDRLFGLFQRLHSANDFPGTGVGLASVRRIVQRHGGEIWADGEPGRGAAFYFTLRD